ncbi:MAG TPA: hypothetical protein DCP62_02300 [Erysipelotrichaceae bacterium]|nr:MAG: hypothetical protein A2Y19_09995 [Firmicutes bacterium GWE2_51_13]HAM62519.1 hypothetical protein [Erysipelotrichaceae bacterium]HAO61775.1 hypothetical protein [Erysipelotrichaceae bacterium]
MRNHIERSMIDVIQSLFGHKVEYSRSTNNVDYGIAKSNVRMELRPLSDFEFEFVKIWDPRAVKHD